ncbi:TetR/AcrR family transcriptional regulator [Catellatospora sp. KI3]|uniref:TetR/AcrR family transcriptional regulator n=1 Tax=Catellatospora sp. KI3 TaxID=3041620 RepID=UPI002482B67E|nr:TetR/AcrR family transcriptional regulator [Catellatospora sp. KI3]MDI1464690.1 TetR/AcrR family transcriptional regulator [Catellatospora sp. KI3]
MTAVPMISREPRQDRSRATRQRLLSAAVQCMAELGWSGATVAVVAERAGVSRGAAQHHFPTREDLVAGLIGHMSEVRAAEIGDLADDLRTGPRRTEKVLSALVELYRGPVFRAALHLWVAAAADEGLRERMRPLEAELGRVAHRMAVELLRVDEKQPGTRETVQATLDLARGLGLAELLHDDTGRRHRVLRQWARTLDLVLPAK